MSKGEKEYQKAQEYKQKYLKNVKENKTLFTDSYKKKAREFLYDASEAGHAQAAYEYAIYASNEGSFEAKTFTFPDGYLMYDTYGQYKHLKRAEELGHPDACFYCAIYLLKKEGQTDNAYQQALKVLKNGRPQDYIPLARYYMNHRQEGPFFPISYTSQYKQALFNLLDSHKYELNFDFLCWDFNVEYCDGLVEFGRYDEALDALNFMLANQQLLKEWAIKYIYSIKVKLYRKRKEYEKAIELCKLMNEQNIGTYDYEGLSRLKEMAQNNQQISYQEVFELYKEKLLAFNHSKDQTLPSTSFELMFYDHKNNVALFYSLADFLWEGHGVKKNQALAFLYYNIAEKHGYYNHDRLGDCYYYGYGTPIDYQKALDYYGRNAYYRSERIEQIANCHYRLQNYKIAFTKYKELYEGKFYKNPPLWLIEGLGWMYFNGKGTEVNYWKAKEIFQIGIQQNSAYSYNMLGLCYLQLPEHKRFAYEQFVKAYELKPEKHIEYNIGRCFEFGFGTKIDLIKAKEWYEKSVRQNYSYAVKRLEEVNQKLMQQKSNQQEDEMKKLVEASERFKNTANEFLNVVQNGGADAIKNAVANKKKQQDVKAVTESIMTNAKKELESLIGLASVKEEVDELEAQMIDYNRRKQMGLPATNISKHMVFTGNAGTGKTTVARIVASILKENNIVSQGQLIETDRAGLIGQYIGETGQKTKKVIDKAIGGVLFIDEAYALAPKDYGKDYGQEAIAILLKMMEDHKDDLVVIVAGYKKEMKDFIDANPGLKSRFTTYIDFPDYEVNELQEIFNLLAKKEQNIVDDRCVPLLNEIWKKAKQVENFGNGRAVRNVYEDVIKRRSKRLRKIAAPTSKEMLTIVPEDIPDDVTEFFGVS